MSFLILKSTINLSQIREILTDISKYYCCIVCRSSKFKIKILYFCQMTTGTFTCHALTYQCFKYDLTDNIDAHKLTTCILQVEALKICAVNL